MRRSWRAESRKNSLQGLAVIPGAHLVNKDSLLHVSQVQDLASQAANEID